MIYINQQTKRENKWDNNFQFMSVNLIVVEVEFKS